MTQQPGFAVTATVLAVSSLTIMANATIAPSLPGLARAFADTPGIDTLAGAVLSLPSLAIILTAGLFGLLADRVDRRSLLIAAMVLYGFGGAYGAIAGSMGEILASRVALGIGVAGVMTIATALAADLWHGEARARFMGRQGAAISTGGIIFLLAGGALAEVTWRGPFLIYLLALPLAAVVLLTLPRLPKRSGAKTAGRFPWTSFLPIGAIAFFAMVMFYLIPTRLPFLLVEIGVPSPSAAGLAIAALTAASIPAALAFARLRSRLGALAIFALSFLAMAIGFALVSVASGLACVIAGTLIAGLGLGLVMPNQNAWLMSVMPADARGRAAGLLTTAVFAGQFVSPFVAGIAASRFDAGDVFAGFSVTLMVAAGAVATWAGVSLLRRERILRSTNS